MKFVASFLSVSLLLLIGRLSGFVREWLIARFGGAGDSTDIAIVLISLPDLMVTLLIGGGFAAAIVPTFQKLPRPEASRMFLQIMTLCGAVFCLVALIVAVMPGVIIHLLSPGLPDAAVRAAIPLFLVATLAIPLTALSGVNQAKLVSREKFWLSQAGTFIFNSAIIAAILIAGQYAFLPAIATGIVAGALIRVLLQLIGIRRIWTPAAAGRVPVDPALFRSLALTTLFAASVALMPVIGRAFASSSATGGLSLFSYAFRISELPIALVFAALATVFLPRISTAYRQGTRDAAAQEIALVLRFSLLLGAAMTIPVIFFARDFIALIFSTTPLTGPQMETLQQTLIVSFLFMPFRGIIVLSLPILSATDNTRRLLPIAATGLGTIFLASWIATGALGVVGAMLGYGLAHLAAAALVLGVLHRKIGRAILPNVFSGLGRCYLLPMLAAAALCWMGARWTDGGLAALAVSAVAFGAFSALLIAGDGDARILFRRIAGRLGVLR